MELSNFTEKFNKLDGKIYTVEEEVTLTNGLYEGMLKHDNVNKDSLNIYTDSTLTGDKIRNYFLSTPSETPWKYSIKIIAPNVNKVYVSYETIGDKVEAEDINNVQNEIVRTQQELNTESARAKDAEEVLTNNLNNEINRATNAENAIENIINTNKPNWDDKYSKNETFTKEEILQKIADLINSAPQTLDTFKEIADALGNDPNFATTIINLLGDKVDKVGGKQLSTEDYTTEEKNKLAAINITENDSIFETAGGTGNTITLTLGTLVNGYSKTFIASANNGGIATTINGKNVYKPCTTTPPNFVKDKAYTIWYNQAGDCFFIKASAEGTALAKDVRKSTTFSNDNDNGIPGGLDLSLLVSGNIRAGVTIDGVSGKATVVDTADAVLDPQYLLTGYSGYDDGVKKVGTMPNKTNTTTRVANHGSSMTVTLDGSDTRMGIISLPNQTGGSGYIDGTSRIEAQLWGLIPSNIRAGQVIGQYPGYGSGYMAGTFTSDANASSDKILSGYSGYVNGNKVTGTMPIIGYANQSQSCAKWDNGDLAVYLAASGYYKAGSGGNSSEVRVPVSQIQAANPDLIGQNIIAGKTICGIGGNASKITHVSGTSQIYHGASDTQTVNLSGLGFTPKLLIGQATIYGRTSYVAWLGDIDGNYSRWKAMRNWSSYVFEPQGESISSIIIGYGNGSGEVFTWDAYTW